MIEQIHWEQYRHSEFLKTLQDMNLNYINLFLKKSTSLASVNQHSKED